MRPTSGPGEAATTSRADRQAFVALLIAALIVLWLARAVIGPFIVAAVLAYAFSPLVWAAEQRTRLPRAVVVGIGYVVAIALLGAAVYLLAGRVANELQELFAAGPDVVAGTLRRLVGTDTITIANQHIDVAALARELQSRAAGLLAEPGEAIHVAATLGEVALQALLVLIVTFYLLIDGHRFRDWTVSLLPAGEQPRTVAIIDRIHDVLGKWLRGQIFLVALVATVVYVFLGPVLHVPYALAIAIVTGILEVIPLIGPLIATAIAGTDAFARGGPELAGLVVVVFFVIRQVEDQVVMPIVIGRAVHLHPVVTIFAVLVGLSTMGVLGGLLGVPVAAALNVVLHELYLARGSRAGTSASSVIDEPPVVDAQAVVGPPPGVDASPAPEVAPAPESTASPSPDEPDPRRPLSASE